MLQPIFNAGHRSNDTREDVMLSLSKRKKKKPSALTTHKRQRYHANSIDMEPALKYSIG